MRKYCLKNNEIIFGETLLVGAKSVRFLKKKCNVRLLAYFSTSKPEFGLILQGNDSILV